MFGDDAAGEGEAKETKIPPKSKNGGEETEQVKKKRKHQKDEEYSVSRGMATGFGCLELSQTN